MVDRFFLSPIPDHRLIPDLDDDPIILLSGPPSSGKTSLLFQFAYNSALRSNTSVVFICSRRRLQSKPPFLSQGTDPSSDVFQRIQMKYIDDYDGIINYFAAFHLHNPLPAAVVIDDFGEFFDERHCREKYNNNARGRELAIVRVLAMCQSAVDHANETGPCKLLLCDTHLGDSMRLLYIYRRWVLCIYTVKGDGGGSFVLKRHYGMRPSKLEMESAKYAIRLQHLVLEAIK